MRRRARQGGVVVGVLALIVFHAHHGAWAAGRDAGLAVVWPTATATPAPGTDQLAPPRAARPVRPTPTATPAAAAASAPASAVTLDPLAGPLVVGASNDLAGTGFTAGSVILLFVAGPTGATSFGPFTPSARTATSLTFSIPASVPLGNGFGTVVVVNTDQGFMQSNPQSAYIFGALGQNRPTILAVNGVGLRAFDATVPLASVETVIAPGSTVTINGLGFNAPRVNLFTPSRAFGALVPLAGGSATEIRVNIPVAAPVGPGALQVVNSPYTGNVVSNAVSVVIGATVSVASVSQMGTTVTVTGTGFSSSTVINLFNAQGGLVANLGGLWPTNGKPRVPITFLSPTQLRFTVPPTALGGASFVQVLNPPFIPFSSSGGDPDGAFTLAAPVTAPGGWSLRFFGTGTGDIDRVKIPLDDPPRPVDVGGAFTLEFRMKTAAGNTSGACVPGGDNWINGNIIFDRDVFGSGDFGDYGISLFGNGGRLAFGVDRLGAGTTICGATNVADGAWHHVAVTRSGSTLRIFVDGALDASGGGGPTGDVSYRDDRPTMYPGSDPFLVIGAEKHDAGAQYPSYHGWIDEVRISTAVRYTGPFTPPAVPFATDAFTAALYHFDEGNGNFISDSALAAGGPSDGVRRFGGSPPGPQWSIETPFARGTPVIALQALTSALTAPTSITHCGDNRLFITEQGGAIRIWDGTQLLATPFLSVTGISSGGEEGLLSMAFHPRYAENGFFYVHYTDSASNVVIARYRVSANPDLADPASRVILLTIPHPGGNHNGGQLQFGGDGYLYAGVGDGGGGCDSAGAGCNAQRNNLLLGKLLRLDVDQNVNAPPFHGIPADNPFRGAGDPRDEIWAKGLRNPWRFAFDRLTHALFIADVGQNLREEVDYQPADSTGGENYGWKMMEGTLCNTCPLDDCAAPLPCDSPLLTPPILDYDHDAGCSITGGYVYRGTRVPFLFGTYVFGDLCPGTLWWSRLNGLLWAATPFGPTAPGLYTFGEDVYGELYVGRGDGVLAKIVPGP